MNKYNLITGVLLTSLFLTGCDTLLPVGGGSVPAATNPVVPPKRTTTPIPAPTPIPTSSATSTSAQADKVKIANQLYQKGKRREAANTYYAAGMESRSPHRERLVLQAVEIAAMLPDTGLMQQFYRSIVVSNLDKNNATRYNYTKGLLALIQKRPKEALDILPSNVLGISAGLANKILVARLRSADLTGDHLSIAKERIHQHSYLKQAKNVDSNRQQIWAHLGKVSESKLDSGRKSTTNTALRGWLDLAYIHILKSDKERLKTNLANWRNNFPHHAAENISYRLSAGSTPSNSTPAPSSVGKSVAVLLPLNGRLGNVGKDLYQGIADAHQQISSSTKLLKYDTSQLDATVVYEQALQEGAGFVLGPFGKENIASISRNGYLQIPVLSLNYIESTASRPSDLFQIGLLPEDEAVQIAQFTAKKGLKRALILVPNSGWGKRLESSFSLAYQSQGGEVVKVIRYPNRASHYRQQVSEVLSAATSVNMIFMAASPTQARLIHPAIANSSLENKPPIYATSHIYSGRPSPSLDNNLNGIIYTEIPYILATSNSNHRYPRLYALGQDAFLISQNLGKLRQGGTLKGKTGVISSSNDGRLHRTLKWATFREGVTVSSAP